MNITDLTATNGADQFYPTPPSISEKMLDDIKLGAIKSILEPSAGKGDLISAFAQKMHKAYRWECEEIDVDAVEIDPYLREICKYNFSEKRTEAQRQELSDLDRMLAAERTSEQNCRMEQLKDEIATIGRVDLHMVHDDFLTFRTYKHYDLILMNPPFADGDKHLLKALDIQKDGGMIVCLLNAETILNPYTASRELLKRKLEEYGAEVSFIEDAFSADAERKARVDVAIVKVTIPAATTESTLFERMKKAAEEEYVPDPEIQALTPANFIDRAICLYNAEVAATLALVKEYNALKPYIAQSFTDKQYSGKYPIIALTVEGDTAHSSFNFKKYMKLVRLKYWRSLFTNDEFTGKLTSNLREQFTKNVEKMADYEFSAFNIKQVMLEMNAAMQQGVHDTIIALFEKLTAEHSWYPECSKNRRYYNGWKTNKAHAVGKKSIIPTNGLFSCYSWDKDRGFDVYTAYNVLSDIEKAFDYLDGGHFAGNRYDLSSFLKYASERRQTRNIECTYFLVDVFKKGTVHIKFRPEAMPLVDRLNIFAAKDKNWLPPSYGQKAYAEMEHDEKAVVDGLNGDGSEGSGEKAYTEILQDRSYYLSAVSSMKLLSE